MATQASEPRERIKVPRGAACAQILFDEKIKTVISGQVGPNAFEVLTKGDIAVFLSPPGLSIKEVIEKFKNGSLNKMGIKRF